MSPEDQASQLARWLAERPGVEPPEGLDPEVIEAVYALRPDLAPAPRVTVDDILAGVTSGPFAGEPSVTADADMEATPIPGVDAEIVSFSASAARRRQRIWGGLGVVAAAAMALFIVSTPNMEPVSGPGSSAEQRAQRALEDAPMAEASPAEQAAPAGKAAAQGDSASADPAPRRQAPRPARSTPTPAPAQEPATTSSLSRYDQLQVGASSGATATGGDVWTPEEAEKAKDARSGPSPLQSVDAPAVAEAEDDAAFYDGVESVSQRAYDMSDADEVQAAGGRAATSAGSGMLDMEERREREGLLGRRNASNTMTPAEPSADYSYETEEELAQEQPLPSDLAGLRAMAWPGDYSDGWWQGSSASPRMSPVLEAARQSAASGDNAAAAQACAALINDPSAPVGQDMAWRAANYAWQAGDRSSATRYISQGKQRSSANSPFLARLYALEGQLYEASGNTEAATQAYRTAAVLNQAR
ncbi:MAG: hypothetical protein H6740_09460 [Alphaproteobacteria bacterium]|nr:hypothetical protein [Alphaproteobacteria bacterium]